MRSFPTIVLKFESTSTTQGQAAPAVYLFEPRNYFEGAVHEQATHQKPSGLTGSPGADSGSGVLMGKPKSSTSQEKDLMCVGFETAPETVLGTIFLRNFDFLFDFTNESLSFVRAHCDGSSLLGPVEDADGPATPGDSQAADASGSSESTTGVTKKKIPKEFFSQRTMIVHLWIICGFFTMGLIVFSIIFCKEYSNSKVSTPSKDQKYEEIENKTFSRDTRDNDA